MEEGGIDDEQGHRGAVEQHLRGHERARGEMVRKRRLGLSAGVYRVGNWPCDEEKWLRRRSAGGDFGEGTEQQQRGQHWAFQPREHGKCTIHGNVLPRTSTI